MAGSGFGGTLSSNNWLCLNGRDNGHRSGCAWRVNRLVIFYRCLVVYIAGPAVSCQKGRYGRQQKNNRDDQPAALLVLINHTNPISAGSPGWR